MTQIIETGQVVVSMPEYRVTKGGTYEDQELVPCHVAEHPEQDVQFGAFFIMNGFHPEPPAEVTQ